MATATKKANNKTEEVVEQTQDNVNSMITLGQESANVALNGMVQTAQIANNTMQNVVNVGLTAQEAGLSVARNYFENMNRIGQEMINMFARTGERTINTVSDMEFAVQRETAETMRDAADNAERAADSAQNNTEKAVGRAAGK